MYRMCAAPNSRTAKSSTEAVDVLFRDEHLLAVNKPASVPAQADSTGDADVLQLLGDPALLLTHRIDRPVSGVLLLARDANTQRMLNEAFAAQTVRKTYLAIVEGRVEGERELEHWLMHDTKAHKARVVPAARKGAFVVRLRLKALTIGERYTLVEVRPEGGRFHQIRAQLAAFGHAIKGDVKYGARRGEPDRSIALFAQRIELAHPVTGEALCVEAPMPATGVWPKLVPAR